MWPNFVHSLWKIAIYLNFLPLTTVPSHKIIPYRTVPHHSILCHHSIGSTFLWPGKFICPQLISMIIGAPSEPFKNPGWLVNSLGLLLTNLLRIMITHSSETYQPTSTIRWDRGISMAQVALQSRTFLLLSLVFDSQQIPWFPVSILEAKALRCQGAWNLLFGWYGSLLNPALKDSKSSWATHLFFEGSDQDCSHFRYPTNSRFKSSLR